MVVCNCSMFCCTLLYVHSSFAIILMVTRELVAWLGLSSCCLVIVVWLFLVVTWVCLRFVILVFPDHTDFLFLFYNKNGIHKLVNVLSGKTTPFYIIKLTQQKFADDQNIIFNSLFMFIPIG